MHNPIWLDGRYGRFFHGAEKLLRELAWETRRDGRRKAMKDRLIELAASTADEGSGE